MSVADEGYDRGEQLDEVYRPEAPPHLREPRSTYGLTLLALGCFLLGLWAAAQYVAYGFGFHPGLGRPWIVLPGGTVQSLAFSARAMLAVSGAVLLLSLALPKLRAALQWLPSVVLLSVLFLGLGRCAAALRITMPAGAGGVFRGGVPLYAPVRFIGWGIAYGGFDEGSIYFPLFSRGLLVGGAVCTGALVCLLTLTQKTRPLPQTGSHGTAAWSDGRELIEGARSAPGAGGAASQGVLLGRQRASGRSAGALLRYRGDGHLVTVAPTRSGKGTGCVIPNLLACPGSMLITDPKGENYAVTARHRSRHLGHLVRALDPFDELGKLIGAGQMGGAGESSSGGDDLRTDVLQATYNPMDLIDPYRDDVLESAGLLADMLVVPSGGRPGSGQEEFWNEEARALLTGLILYVSATELDEELRPTARRTLAYVRELLTLPRDDFRTLMRRMSVLQLSSGLVARAAARHLQKEERERSGVVSTAQSHTHFLDSPHMARTMARSSIDLGRLKYDRMTIYLVLPAHYLDAYARWLRLVVACALHELARTPGLSPRDDPAEPPSRVLFLLDEFAHLGRMNPVLRAVTLMAGYGVQVWTLWQDLSQLKGLYPDQWGTFLANADVLQAFSASDNDTARYLSELTGETTLFVRSAGESLSRSRGRSATRSQGANRGFAERGRRLLFPDEVRRMPAEEQLLFVKGMRPVHARKIDYLTDLEFRKGGKAGGRPIYDENPLHRRLHGLGHRARDAQDGHSRKWRRAQTADAGSSGRAEETLEGKAMLGADEAFELGLADPDLPEALREP